MHTYGVLITLEMYAVIESPPVGTGEDANM